jgi:hypothetical protein
VGKLTCFIYSLFFVSCITCLHGLERLERIDNVEQPKTIISVVHPIIEALIQANKFKKYENNRLFSINDIQRSFLEKYMPQEVSLKKIKKTLGLEMFSKKELFGAASSDIDELNKLLKREGFDIQLDSNIPDTFGTVGILKIFIEWIKKAKESVIIDKTTQKEYPAVMMEVNEGECKVYEDNSQENFVIKITTKSGDIVRMSPAKRAPSDAFELVKNIEDLSSNVKQMNLVTSRNYDSFVYFPMVDINISKKLEWLIKMKLCKDIEIAQALQQTKFKMDTEGASVESAVALLLRECCVSHQLEKNFIIDKPFYLWIERPGVKDTIFCAYITQKNWNSPKKYT